MPHSRFRGKLPAVIWFHLETALQALGVPSVGGPVSGWEEGGGRTHTIIVNNPFLCCWIEVKSRVTEKFHLYMGDSMHRLEGHCQPARNPNMPQSKGSQLGCKPAM